MASFNALIYLPVSCLRIPWICCSAVLALNEACEQCKNTQAIPLPAPNHSPESINSAYKTLKSFLMHCAKRISAISFCSTPHNNLTIWTELLVHSSWGMRLLHTVTLPGKAPAQPWDCCTSPHRQNCSRQMEKPMLEQQMTVGAKTHFSWKDQEANDETNPTKMCRGHLPWRFRARFVMQIENSSFQEENEWKQRDYLTQEKRQLQGSFCYQTGTVEIAMAPGWFLAELLVTPTIFQPPFPQHCSQPSVWRLKGWTVTNHLSNGI